MRATRGADDAKPRVLDLFSGIGGFALGLERAGMATVAFCESDPYARLVLNRHWPGVPCYDDVRTLTASRLAADGIGVDIICGGFPCQDISRAGRRAGITGAKSGLWREYARLIGELKPRWIVAENVAAIIGRGLKVVLGDLSAIGYDAEWHCIPAAYFGAPHIRDRCWLVAYPHRDGCRNPAFHCGVSARLSERFQPLLKGLHASASPSAWPPEPAVGRVADGVSERSHRLRCLGNAVVPQIPQMIGEVIMMDWRAGIGH